MSARNSRIETVIKGEKSYETEKFWILFGITLIVLGVGFFFTIYGLFIINKKINRLNKENYQSEVDYYPNPTKGLQYKDRTNYIGQTKVVYPFVFKYPYNMRIGENTPNNIYNNPTGANIYSNYRGYKHLPKN